MIKEFLLKNNIKKNLNMMTDVLGITEDSKLSSIIIFDEQKDWFYRNKKEVCYSPLDAEVLDYIYKNNNLINKKLDKTLEDLGLERNHYSYYKIMDNILIPKLKKEIKKEVYDKVLYTEIINHLQNLVEGQVPENLYKKIALLDDLDEEESELLVEEYFKMYPKELDVIKSKINKTQLVDRSYRDITKQVPELLFLLQGKVYLDGTQMFFVTKQGQCYIKQSDRRASEKQIEDVFINCQKKGMEVNTLVVYIDTIGKVHCLQLNELVILSLKKNQKHLDNIKVAGSIDDLSWDYFLENGRVLKNG